MSARTRLRLASAATLLVLAVLAASPIVHAHSGVQTQADDHCGVCHVRHLSAIGPLATVVHYAALLFAPSAPLEVFEDEQDAFLELHPSRGPPA
jgi:hypothetical protein